MSDETDPEVMQALPVPPGEAGTEQPAGETITEPAKLLRIASMVRELLEETRQTALDEPGRKRLAQIYTRAMGELAGVLSEDLRDELASLAPPVDEVPTEAELRVAQAQLVGWLEGLFHGIQAAMFAQQAAARAQFEELRRRGLLAQNPLPEATADDGTPRPRGGGQYL
ncbi:MAG: proteasome activator [Actinomycetota bacterium]